MVLTILIFLILPFIGFMMGLSEAKHGVFFSRKLSLFVYFPLGFSPILVGTYNLSDISSPIVAVAGSFVITLIPFSLAAIVCLVVPEFTGFETRHRALKRVGIAFSGISAATFLFAVTMNVWHNNDWTKGAEKIAEAEGQESETGDKTRPSSPYPASEQALAFHDALMGAEVLTTNELLGKVKSAKIDINISDILAPDLNRTQIRQGVITALRANGIEYDPSSEAVMKLIIKGSYSRRIGGSFLIVALLQAPNFRVLHHQAVIDYGTINFAAVLANIDQTTWLQNVDYGSVRSDIRGVINDCLTPPDVDTPEALAIKASESDINKFAAIRGKDFLHNFFKDALPRVVGDPDYHLRLTSEELWVNKIYRADVRVSSNYNLASSTFERSLRGQLDHFGARINPNARQRLDMMVLASRVYHLRHWIYRYGYSTFSECDDSIFYLNGELFRAPMSLALSNYYYFKTGDNPIAESLKDINALSVYSLMYYESVDKLSN